MKTSINEIEFFSTKQSDAFLSMANNLIRCYNSLSSEKMPIYNSMDEIWKNENYKMKNVSAYNAMIRKFANIIFNNGDPLSVPILLKNIANNKIQGLGHGGQYDSKLNSDENKSVNYGKGHFRWDWQAYTLNETELKAVKLYLKTKSFDISKTEFRYKNFLVSAVLNKSGVPFPDQKDGGLHNKFNVSVTNTENQNCISFDFYGSTNDFNNAVTEIENDDLLSAFECFISDSIAGMLEFDDFCSEFGYDNDSRSAERIHKECLKSLAKAQVIIDADLYEFANELQKAIN